MASGPTSYDPKYLRSGFIPRQSYSYENGTVYAPDFLDVDYQNSLSSLKAGGDIRKPGNLPLTTLVYNVPEYACSSVYWTLLAANGFVNWIGIKEGTFVTSVDVTPLSTSEQYSDHSFNNPTATLTQMEI